jgi:class 3 adenylate cyclase
LQDYIGPVVNQAARLQTLAKPGQVLVNRRIQRATSVDWYSFENVTSKLGKRLTSLKGLSEFEREIYLVTHKYHRY